jgi:predicted transcriptional regulator
MSGWTGDKAVRDMKIALKERVSLRALQREFRVCRATAYRLINAYCRAHGLAPLSERSPSPRGEDVVVSRREAWKPNV